MQDNSNLPLFPLQNETREIPLTQGKFAIVDAADYDWLMQWKWCAYEYKGIWYAHRAMRSLNGKKTTIGMHRVILDAPKGMLVDHQDGNGLNNTRKNLRLCTYGENNRNARSQTRGSSQYKGVNWHKQTQKWQACVRINGKQKYLGLFCNEIDAALCYDAAARDSYGEFARVNFGEKPNNELEATHDDTSTA